MSVKVTYKKDEGIKFYIDMQEQELKFTLNCALILEKVHNDIGEFYSKLQSVTVCADALCVMINEHIIKYNKDYNQNEKPITLATLNKMLDIESMIDIYDFIKSVQGILFKEQKIKNTENSKKKDNVK